MCDKNCAGSTPAFQLERQLANNDIQSGVISGLAQLSGQEEAIQPSDRLHNTKELLRQYRRIAYAVKASEADLNLRMELTHNTNLSTLEVNAALAGIDLSGTKLESYTKSVIRSKSMLHVIDHALSLVREDPDRGELFYQVLYWTYFSPTKPKNRDGIIKELEKAGFPMSTSSYHNYQNDAIRVIDSILWGYTTRWCFDIIRQFLPNAESPD